MGTVGTAEIGGKSLWINAYAPSTYRLASVSVIGGQLQKALAAGNGTRRLSVHADTASIDLVLSAAVPLGSLIPVIVDVLVSSGDFNVGLVAAGYQLSTPDGAVLDTSKTLNALEIRDGTTLALARSSMELIAPDFDDTGEAVAATIAAVEQRWTRRAAHLVGALVASCMTGVSAAILLRTAFGAGEAHRTGCVGTAGTISVTALLAGFIAYRVFGEHAAGVTLGLTSTAFAALAGLSAVPGGPGAPNALFAAAAATTSAAVIRVIARDAVIFTTLASFTATCMAAAVVAVVTGAPLPVIGAGLAAMSLALVEASPPMSIMLARLSPLLQTGSIPDPNQLHARAIRAHTWLTSLVAAFSASAALGATSAVVGTSRYGAPRLPDIVFATVTGSVLLLRARAHQELARSIPPIICGAATLSAVLVAFAAAYPHHGLHIAALSMLLGAGALYLGFVGGSTEVSPAGRRSIELIEYLAFSTVVPLAFWLCGLYGAARSVNLS